MRWDLNWLHINRSIFVAPLNNVIFHAAGAQYSSNKWAIILKCNNDISFDFLLLFAMNEQFSNDALLKETSTVWRLIYSCHFTRFTLVSSWTQTEWQQCQMEIAYSNCVVPLVIGGVFISKPLHFLSFLFSFILSLFQLAIHCFMLLAFYYCHCYLISPLKSSVCYEMPHCALFASNETKDFNSQARNSNRSYHSRIAIDIFESIIFLVAVCIYRSLSLTYWSTFINEIWRLSLNKLSVCPFHLLELSDLVSAE